MKKLFLLLLISTMAFAIDEVRIRPPQSAEDASHTYFVELLQLALDKTETTYGEANVVITERNMTQGRALLELQNGEYIDVDWAGTSVEREELLRPIRIPLIGGLLGYRVPVIRREDEELFDMVRSIDDLRFLTAVQGSHWPDSDILENAGLRILRVPKFEVMYPMLANSRVDYFPRGINEVYAEVNRFGEGNLIAYDKLIIAYRFPMYFFTSIDNEELAKRIEDGLMKAIEDGSFEEFVMEQEATKGIFPLEQYKDSRIIYIDNPLLPPLTPVNDSKLWFRI